MQKTEIMNAKSLNSQKQVKNVLGMIWYHHKFVRNYAKIAAYLHDLLKIDRKKFQRNVEVENAF